MRKKPRRGFSMGGQSFPEAWLLRNIPCREDTPFPALAASVYPANTPVLNPNMIKNSARIN
jgi:hypothetical protein